MTLSCVGRNAVNFALTLSRWDILSKMEKPKLNEIYCYTMWYFWLCVAWLADSIWVKTQVELGWIRLIRVKSGWVELSRIELGWIGLNRVESNLVRLRRGIHGPAPDFQMVSHLPPDRFSRRTRLTTWTLKLDFRWKVQKMQFWPQCKNALKCHKDNDYGQNSPKMHENFLN